MSGNQKHFIALGDASNRANISLARPVVGQKQLTNGPAAAIPSFTEFIAMTGTSQAASKTPGPTGRSATTTSGVAGNAPKTGTAGKKRKSETTLEEDIAAYKQNLDHIVSRDDFEDDPIPSCNVVRGRINKLLDSGIMKKTEFTKAIGVNANSLNKFLQASGQMGGSGSSTYYNAWAWFKQREVAKVKMPDVKKRQKLEADAATAAAAGGTEAGSSSSRTPSSAAMMAVATALLEISNIHLPGEETDSVEVYDTCDEIRRKINAHLKTPGLTQTQFCRDLYAQLRAPKCKAIQSKQLADFRAMKGPRTGARSSVFYAAYVYFEKLRLARGGPKSAHRTTMESVWAAEGGFERDVDHRTGFIVPTGSTVHFDQYGLARTGGYGYY
ncbi:hypothetical protein F5Y12DRAFT_184604 [Xylaria sp. FL1777]|nr:hypothetical protein F5Y12DRAFT_184604 [Xylaria sp. FL1777]